jgi:CBS domain-containing protein
MELPYKTLKQILAAKPFAALSVAPETTVLSALKTMAAKGVGFLVVLEREKLVVVVSERDYARKVVLEGKASADTSVREIMTEKVVSVTVDQTVPQCMALMDKGGFRHLPVVEGNKVIGVLSIRDLLKEVVSHHEHLIRDLERERLEIMNPDPSSY